uniref:uncharacterized protein n=1 Tax=Lonchura striata TaxID=40157 RepID=UPI000B4C7708|nr:uncharacterized protein LOC110467626 [Lonchura striata domestica]
MSAKQEPPHEPSAALPAEAWRAPRPAGTPGASPGAAVPCGRARGSGGAAPVPAGAPRSPGHAALRGRAAREAVPAPGEKGSPGPGRTAAVRQLTAASGRLEPGSERAAASPPPGCPLLAALRYGLRLAAPRRTPLGAPDAVSGPARPRPPALLTRPPPAPGARPPAAPPGRGAAGAAMPGAPSGTRRRRGAPRPPMARLGGAGPARIAAAAGQWDAAGARASANRGRRPPPMARGQRVPAGGALRQGGGARAQSAPQDRRAAGAPRGAARHRSPLTAAAGQRSSSSPGAAPQARRATSRALRCLWAWPRVAPASTVPAARLRIVTPQRYTSRQLRRLSSCPAAAALQRHGSGRPPGAAPSALHLPSGAALPDRRAQLPWLLSPASLCTARLQPDTATQPWVCFHHCLTQHLSLMHRPATAFTLSSSFCKPFQHCTPSKVLHSLCMALRHLPGVAQSPLDHTRPGGMDLPSCPSTAQHSSDSEASMRFPADVKLDVARR